MLNVKFRVCIAIFSLSTFVMEVAILNRFRIKRFRTFTTIPTFIKDFVFYIENTFKQQSHICSFVHNTFRHTFILIRLGSRLVHVTLKTVQIPLEYRTPIQHFKQMIRSGLVEKVSHQGGGHGRPVSGSSGVSSADGLASRTSWAGEGSAVGGENAGADGGEGGQWWPPLQCNG
jgi:hypothetical protein